jgi:hypothetical protein
VANLAAGWRRLKALVLDSVSCPITEWVYNLGLDEFFAWYGQEPHPGFSKATVAAWRVALEARGLGAVSMREPAVEAADKRLLAPELASGITRVKGVPSKGVRLGNWLSRRDIVTKALADQLMRRRVFQFVEISDGGEEADYVLLRCNGRSQFHQLHQPIFASHSCGSACTDATKCVARSNGRVC